MSTIELIKMNAIRRAFALAITLIIGGCSTFATATGDGFIGLARTGFDVPSEKIIKRTKSDLEDIAIDLGLDKNLRYQLTSLEPKRVIMVKEHLREKAIRDAVVLVEGDVEVDSIRNAIVVATGKISARVVTSSVVAAGNDISITQIGGREEDSLVMTRRQLESESVYSSTVLADRGAKLGAPTYVYAINTKVSTPYPSRVQLYHVDRNPLQGMSSKIYW